MYDIYNDPDYALWCARSVMADCFRALGFNGLAVKIMKVEKIEQYLPIIESEAARRNHQDILTRLASNGLLTQGASL